jgi:hypothetical protein
MVTCPICKSEGEEIEGDAFDGMWFRCLKHREFGVSDTALKTRKNAEPEQWERSLKKAIERAGPEERPENSRRGFFVKSEIIKVVEARRGKARGPGMPKDRDRKNR